MIILPEEIRMKCDGWLEVSIECHCPVETTQGLGRKDLVKGSSLEEEL